VTIEVCGIGKPGRLTGGGSLRTDGGKSHHQVQLGCTAAEGGKLRSPAEPRRGVGGQRARGEIGPSGSGVQSEVASSLKRRSGWRPSRRWIGSNVGGSPAS
jgi:hypothetical protein